MKNLKNILATTLALASFSYGFDYKIDGGVQNWSKFGFNDDKIDTTKGKYPTDSFSVLSASLGVNMNLGAGFSLGLGGTVGGVVFDNTKYQMATTGELYNPQGLAWNYFGFYAGPDYRSTASERTARNWLVQNAFIGYEYDKYIQIKIGRFSIPGSWTSDWLSSYIQGASISTSVIPHTRIWALTTNRRASLGGKWLKDFKYMNQNVDVDNGKGFFVYVVGANFNYENFSVTPYFYGQDSRFVAPGFHLTYDTNPAFKSEGFRSKTELVFLYMKHVGPALKKTSSYNNYDNLLYLDAQIAGKGGESLYIKQTFEIDNYNFGVMFYKNFGNPNEFLSPYGDPTGLDNYDNSVYDAAAWNNVFRRDAINGFLFVGGKYSQLSWSLLGRLTYTPRADEQAVSFNVDYKFPLNITAGIKLEYYSNTTYKGYTIKATKLTQNITQDRSFISTQIAYSF